MSDNTTFARAVKTWACEEMLKQVCEILGLKDGDDLIDTVKRLKRRVAELQKELEVVKKLRAEE